MRRRTVLFAAVSAASASQLLSTGALSAPRAPDASVGDLAGEADSGLEVVVTARRRAESADTTPIPIAVFDENFLTKTNTFNVARLREVLPSLQFFSSNSRNTSVNIRGLGSPFGLTNDGIDPGVGVYVDGVLYARPAATAFDFIDIKRIEVLRGPQGVLFGRNTTAGAVNIVTEDPSATPEAKVELSYGNYDYLQAKASLSGPIAGDRLTGRIAFSGTRRDGTVRNVRLNDDVNDLNNISIRGKIVYAPDALWRITAIGDWNRQQAECCTQLVARVAPTLRSANRQFLGIIRDLNYAPPSFNAFDRLTDVDTPLIANQDLGGASLTVERTIGAGTFTSISAWRYWRWNPSSDRDFLGLPITTISANPSQQRQWSQELRYAGPLTPHVDAVIGAYFFKQSIDTEGAQEQGAAAARFLLAPSALATPALLNGLRQDTNVRFDNLSAALYAELDWRITDQLRLTPGVRFNDDKKKADFSQIVSGGLSPASAAERALQNSVLATQVFQADVNDFNVSGQITGAYDLRKNLHIFVTYARSFKPVGLNIGGLPLDAAGAPALSAAVVRPEDVRDIEAGLKSRWFGGRLTADVTAFRTTTNNFQTQVVNNTVGVLRGFLANADKVRVKGVEADIRGEPARFLSVYGSAVYNDARYVRFPDAPAPIELVGGPAAVDASGGRLPGVSRWSASAGGEAHGPAHLASGDVEAYVGVDASYRSEFSSNPTPSRFLNVAGYGLLNLRAGVRAPSGAEIFLWARNVTQTEYFEFLTAAPGGSGLIVGQVGDPRTYGVTVRGRF